MRGLILVLLVVTPVGVHPVPGTVLSTLRGMLFNGHCDARKSLLVITPIFHMRTLRHRLVACLLKAGGRAGKWGS